MVGTLLQDRSKTKEQRVSGQVAQTAHRNCHPRMSSCSRSRSRLSSSLAPQTGWLPLSRRPPPHRRLLRYLGRSADDMAMGHSLTCPFLPLPCFCPVWHARIFAIEAVHTWPGHFPQFRHTRCCAWSDVEALEGGTRPDCGSLSAAGFTRDLTHSGLLIAILMR